jgi:hypothetical protein
VAIKHASGNVAAFTYNGAECGAYQGLTLFLDNRKQSVP